MNKYILNLEEDLSEDDIQRILDAIFLLRGTKNIEKVEDDFSPNISQSIKANSPSPDFVSPKNISPQSQPFVAQTSPTQMNPTQMNPAQMNPAQINPAQMNPAQMNPAQMNPTQMNPTQAHPTPENAASQRKIISEALRWGIHNKKITLEEIRDVSPQETVNIAQKIIETMPDEEKKKFLKF